MTNLSEKFSTLEGLLADQNTAILASLTAIEETLGLVSTTLEILNENGAANTKAILTALAAGTPCIDCGATGIFPPVLPVGANPIDTDKCKRMQALIVALTEFMSVMDLLSAFGFGFRPDLIISSFNEAVDGLDSGDAVPLPTYGEAMAIVGEGINYAAVNIVERNTLADLFAGVSGDLLTPMYLASSSSDVKAAIDGVIDGSAIPSYARGLIKALAYPGVVDYYTNTATTPNLSGFDGTVCGGGIGGITECVTIPSSTGAIAGGSHQYINFPPQYSLDGWFINGDLFGYNIEVVSGHAGSFIAVQFYTSGTTQGTAFSIPVGGNQTVAVHGVAFRITTYLGTGTEAPFTIRLCPPGS